MKIPDGYALVPINLAPEMREAALEVDCWAVSDGQDQWKEGDDLIWQRLLETAPAPPEEKITPVAVVLPERKRHIHQGLSHTDARADGWNACLDEVARLNPSNP